MIPPSAGRCRQEDDDAAEVRQSRDRLLVVVDYAEARDPVSSSESGSVYGRPSSYKIRDCAMPPLSLGRSGEADEVRKRLGGD